MTTYDWNALMQQAGAGMEPLPPGDYDVQCTSCEASSSSTGKLMYKARFQVVTGPHAGRPVYNNFTLSPENPNALAFFFRHMRAMGLDNTFFASNPAPEAVAEAMKGRTCNVKLGMRAYQGEMRNNVEGISPSGVQAGVPQPTMGVPAPAAGFPPPMPAPGAPAGFPAPPAPQPGVAAPPMPTPAPMPAAPPMSGAPPMPAPPPAAPAPPPMPAAPAPPPMPATPPAPAPAPPPPPPPPAPAPAAPQVDPRFQVDPGTGMVWNGTAWVAPTDPSVQLQQAPPPPPAAPGAPPQPF